jgi:hypothetical protein
MLFEFSGKELVFGGGFAITGASILLLYPSLMVVLS